MAYLKRDILSSDGVLMTSFLRGKTALQKKKRHGTVVGNGFRLAASCASQGKDNLSQSRPCEAKLEGSRAGDHANKSEVGVTRGKRPGRGGGKEEGKETWKWKHY